MMIPSDVVAWLPVKLRVGNWSFLAGHGGYSGALLWRRADSTSDWCLRRWPLRHPQPERLAQIHGWLRHAGQVPLPYIPVPVIGTNEKTWFENAQGRWECTPWMPGKADFEARPSVERLANVAVGLARFHNTFETYKIQSPDPPPAVVERIRRFQQLADGEINQLEMLCGKIGDGELSDFAGRTLVALKTFGPRFRQQLLSYPRGSTWLQPCLRDIWHDHVLFEGDRLTGIIDFGAMKLDTPTTDISRLFGSLLGDRNDLWIRAREAYDKHNATDDSDWILAQLLDRSGCLLGAANWLRWLIIEQRRFEDMTRVRQRMGALLSRIRGWDPLLPDAESLTR